MNQVFEIDDLLTRLPGDDETFLGIVRTLVLGAVRTSAPGHAYIVRVDTWFGDRWLGFGGWAASGGLRLPPIMPNRVPQELAYDRDELSSRYVVSPHARVHVGKKYGPIVADATPGSSLFWVSGGSEKMGRGVMMAYVLADRCHHRWFVELERGRDGWRYTKKINIASRVLDEILLAGAPSEPTTGGNSGRG